MSAVVLDINFVKFIVSPVDNSDHQSQDGAKSNKKPEYQKPSEIDFNNIAIYCLNLLPHCGQVICNVIASSHDRVWRSS
jgi:hypothetical protein